MKSVKVMFKNNALNYTTSVSAQSTLESVTIYFVGTWFDMGVYPNENLEECIKIEFNNNIEL